MIKMYDFKSQYNKIKEEIDSSIRSLNKGDNTEALVLSIEPERERISLGIKQLKPDVFNDFIKEHKKGTKVLAKVISFDEERINLSLSDGIRGYMSQKDFSNSSAGISLEEGIEIEVVIANINDKDREIILSLRALEKQEEKSALKDNAERNREIEKATKSNIGDLIKAEMEETPNEDE